MGSDDRLHKEPSLTTGRYCNVRDPLLPVGYAMDSQTAADRKLDKRLLITAGIRLPENAIQVDVCRTEKIFHCPSRSLSFSPLAQRRFL